MSKRIKILIVEDEETCRTPLKIMLENKDYLVIEAENGCEALEKINEEYDVILLDLMLPDMDGIEVLKAIRNLTATTVIVISALESKAEIDKAFDNGADDYMIKTKFDEQLLLAKLRKFLNKRDRGYNDNIQVGNICIDTRNKIVLVNNKRISLSNIEYRILELFIENPNKIFNQKSIIDEIWGKDYPLDENQVRWHINNIREKIEEVPKRPKIIVTEHGRGYIFVAANE
ncbi:MAG: hypothetical protein A2X61_15880 [Ignavibacteria bacterium GWB2_35_12]|nr:MAG: hypothetical protein A2X61_15880 [Ignavibacteria bacterium GWB2_35_12]OGU87143.1 MAG: hypothetical protein A2220_08255 [Ignavibacteria bacterium RIFOXYA2_FULL_35_10]OGV24678.1 MAG: hypothetical protein A2475_14655 [Ignavibacteria bacterium RIFOXYC2_FULL_35_21]